MKSNEKRHAYLIMAHNDLYCLSRLIELLDHERNDIFLHLDSKCKISGEELSVLQKLPIHSRVYLTDRMDVRWGGYEQIECELRLLEAAVPHKYEYYHLLSGHDLPIKSMRHILEFFDEHTGKEFISFYREKINESNIPRMKYYYRELKPYRLDRLYMKLQRIFRVDRVKASGYEYMKGGNWFSITHRCAEFLVENESDIRKYFMYTRCPDEIFLQTLVYSNPELRANIASDYHDIDRRILDTDEIAGNLRTMEWPDSLGTAHPRTLVVGDYELLMKNKALFARKFDTDEDREIIDMICEKVKVGN